jgi:hypothetical protein
MSIWGIVSPALTYGSYGVSSGVATIAMSGGYGVSSGAMPLYIASYETPVTGSATLFLSSLDQCQTWRYINQQWERLNNLTLEAWNVMPTSCFQGSYKTKQATAFIYGAAVGQFTASMPMFICNSGDGVVQSNMTLFMYAPNFNTSSGTIFIKGHESVNSSVEIFISGENYSSASSGTIFINGNAESTIEGELYIFGME